MADQMKIFLSHKGIDKPRVRLFKGVLVQLGFAPWLDEDAMPAGTELERGLLQGFKDSCAAVFFVTPAFHDENYLAKEVEYAIQQKHEKGDRFAIIALSLGDHTGAKGVIPELFQGYVWKEPETELEALGEILRALPIQLGKPHWIGEVEPDVPGVPNRKTATTPELSEEATKLLMEAVCDSRGYITMTNLRRGFEICTNGKDVVGSRDPKVVAAWRAAIQELARQRLIEPRGTKGESFTIANSGYEKADALRLVGLDEVDRAIRSLNHEERNYLLTLSRPRNEGRVPIGWHENFRTREATKYPEMIDSFLAKRLMRNGEKCHLISATGYKVTVRIWQIIILKAIQKLQTAPHEYADVDQLAKESHLTDGDAEHAELQRHLKDVEKSKYIESVPVENEIGAARLTPDGQSFLRNYSDLEFSVED